MNNAKIAITSFFFLALVGEAQAQEAYSYSGSDTLGPIVNALIGTGTCGNIIYDEAGSSIGHAALVAGSQYTAPMSSSISKEVCDANPNARQVEVAVDRILVVRNNLGSDKSCDTDFVADVPGYESNAPKWAEALQLIYGGVYGAGTFGACGGPSGRANTKHPRVKLLNNWSSIFSNSCASGECTQLRFAFRRGDFSSTTKIFKKLINIDNFCGGKQHEDLDPVRTACGDVDTAGGVNYCPKKEDGSYADFGVVQAIELAKSLPMTQRRECVEGAFEWLSLGFDTAPCPDGARRLGGHLCQYPVDCNRRYGCINTAGNPNGFDFVGDGRYYNDEILDGLGHPLDIPTETTKKGEKYTFSRFALSVNGRCTGGETGLNATLQIGCLVSQLDCSIGFGGRSMIDAPVTSDEFEYGTFERQPKTFCVGTTKVPDGVGSEGGLTVSSADNTASKFDVNGQAVGEASKDYRLTRKLYINSLKVPTNDAGDLDCTQIFNAEEQAFCECVFDDAKLAAAVGSTSFVPLEGGAKVVSCGG